ncbi:ORF1629 [Mocis latipes granulovirus]|uniref:ORF1629 n=1 Tax=Mocis latipes granulovirus TaxID=2072024 RepID=A0A162GWF0_9BBAC|nr:ORF1629 [Mocis latipes granulovirus]AKR17480.1 ORF1629 [Mocis latipes granulovirus]
MELLEFIVNAGFRADGRQAIMRMRGNYALKKQLESDATHVQLNMDQCEELLNTLLQMFELRSRPTIYPQQQIPLLYNNVPPPPPTPPVPRSRRSSYMSVDFQDVIVPAPAQKTDINDVLPDFNNHVVETEFQITDKDIMPPPPPPPPPPIIDPMVVKTTNNVESSVKVKNVELPKPISRNYIDDIKQGVTLKKVVKADDDTRRKTNDNTPEGMMLAIRNKIDQRRQATEISDYSEPNSDWSS